MMNRSKGNEWLWTSRWTHWVFKNVSDNVDGMSAPCMDPVFIGCIDVDEMARDARAFRKADINVVLTEGLRRLMLYEQEGKTDLVIDALKKAADACHREGIRIIHHTTATLVGRDIDGYSDTQREWLSMDARTGKYAYLNKWGGWYLWCLNNPGFRTEYFRLSQKIMAEAGLDGFMTDEVNFRAGWHNCSCPHCREKFRSQTGHVLPDADTASFWGNFENPAFRAWLRFRLESVGDFYQDLHRALCKAHPHPVLLGCKNDEPAPQHSQYYGENNDERMRGTNLLFVEAGTGDDSTNLFGRRRLAFNLTAYQGLSNHYGTPTLAILYHNRNEFFFTWALQVAHGMRVWATAGITDDSVLSPKNQLLNFPGDLALYSELFAWEKGHESELAGAIRPFANIGLLLSSATRDLADHGGGWNYYVREIVGWGEALTDAQIQYAVMVEQDLTPAGLRPYALVILPNASHLSEAACRAIVEYVSGGGALIFTNETGWYDETGSRRNAENRLGSVLGIPPGVVETAPSPQFGKHGLGKWVYFAHKPGIAAYTTTSVLGSARRRDTEDVPVISDEDRRRQTSQMIEAVRWAAADSFPLHIRQAPEGLLIKAYHGRDAKSVVIHLLNCRDEDKVAFGEKIPPDAPMVFPPLTDDIIMDMEIESARCVYLVSPDWEGKTAIRPESADRGGVRLTIPAGALKRYAVLCVVK
jgi:hypothetical protein